MSTKTASRRYRRRADLERAKSATPRHQRDVVAAASAVLAAETVITRLQRQALSSSPAWATASADLDLANKNLAAARAHPDQSVNKVNDVPAAPPAADPLGYVAQIQNLTTERNAVEAQKRPLMDQLRRIDSHEALLMEQQEEGLHEELLQARQQEQQGGGPKTAAGAPSIHFSPKVSPLVRKFLQNNLDEKQRMKDDPAYAAAKRKEQQADLAKLQATMAEQSKQPDPAEQDRNEKAQRDQYDEQQKQQEEEETRRLKDSADEAERAARSSQGG